MAITDVLGEGAYVIVPRKAAFMFLIPAAERTAGLSYVTLLTLIAYKFINEEPVVTREVIRKKRAYFAILVFPTFLITTAGQDLL